jgi:hypothetical protein
VKCVFTLIVDLILREVFAPNEVLIFLIKCLKDGESGAKFGMPKCWDTLFPLDITKNVNFHKTI